MLSSISVPLPPIATIAATRNARTLSDYMLGDGMAEREPIAELHQPFSSEGATPTAWAEGRRHLEKAKIYWLSTVRPDGRPHVTPMVAIWMDGAI